MSILLFRRSHDLHQLKNHSPVFGSFRIGTYFPIRFVVTSLAVYYPRPYSAIIKECVILAIYLMTATLISLQIEKNNLKEK